MIKFVNINALFIRIELSLYPPVYQHLTIAIQKKKKKIDFSYKTLIKELLLLQNYQTI